MTRRNMIMGVVVVLAALGGSLGVGLLDFPGWSPLANAEEPEVASTETEVAAVNTSTVVIDTLVSSTEYNGDLGFDDKRELVAKKQGTITWVPAKGSILEPGDVLWEIDRQPVVYLPGDTPLYRELYRGVSKGDDVLQLEEYLISIGLGPEGWEANTSFNWTTHEAVKDLEELHGMKEDGRIGPADVVVGTDALRVEDVAYLGADAAGVAVLTVTDATATVTTNSTSRQLASFLETPSVEIVLADGSRLDADLEKTEATPADENGNFGYTVTYTVTGGVDEPQPVKINIERTLAADALTVPVDALVALVEGGYAIEVQTDDGRVLRAVEVIDFDDTSVAITGDVVAGDLVVVP